jgi:hypothetical protein
MKIKDISEWSWRWSTPSGTLDAYSLVAEGVLVDLSLWGTSVINLAVQWLDGRYFGSLSAPGCPSCHRGTMIAVSAIDREAGDLCDDGL